MHSATKPRDAGILHLATGTWTRAATETANLGPMVIYNNDALSPYYVGLDGGQTWIDNGRVPSTSSPSPVGTYDAYEVNGLSLAYCTSNSRFSFDLNLSFWNVHGGNCVDPTAAGTIGPDHLLTVSGMPGASGSGPHACWLLNLDLAGGTEFCLPADGNGSYAGFPDQDGFGFGFGFSDTSAGNAGPMLAGDPQNFPFGDGTDFQNPGATGTGLDTQDLLWLHDPNQLVMGCYFWDYPYPYASLYQRVHAAGCCASCGGPCGDQGVSCTSGSNSLGTVADLGYIGSCLVADNNFTLVASSVPDNMGLFIYSNGTMNIPLGDGRLCVNGSAGIVRLFPVVMASGNQAQLTLDLANPPAASGLITAGSTWYFQEWYRDPGFGSSGFNLTNGHEIFFM
ncbi:MAG: hypothetical protein CMJ87_03100 [Planctomycetes bacterium]|nr:hypothetical protein [Planctomycetota bacterium]